MNYKPLDYFILAMKNGAYKHRTFITRSFKVVEVTNGDVIPYVPYRNDEGELEFTDGKEVHTIETVKGEPLLNVKQRVTIDNSILAIVGTEPVEDYLGNIIYNAVMFQHGARGKIPYYHGKFDEKVLNKIVLEALQNGDLTPADFEHRLQIARGFLTVFTGITVPTATKLSFANPPGIEKIKKDYLAKNKDKMSDPAVAAALDKLLEDYLDDYIKDDDAAGHLISRKDKIARLKLYGHIGSSVNPQDPTKMDYIKSSLRDGWQPEDLPIMSNSSRAASSSRGLATAVGGYQAKKSSSTFMNTKLSMDDCGSKVGVRLLVTPYNYKEYIGRYLVGSLEPMDEAKCKSIIGKNVPIRDPNACWHPNKAHYCKTCMGDVIGKSGIGIASSLSESTGSRFLQYSLAAFHQTSISLEEYSVERSFV